MRLLPALTLVTLVAAGCGVDEPAPEQAPPVEEARPAPPAPLQSG